MDKLKVEAESRSPEQIRAEADSNDIFLKRLLPVVDNIVDKISQSKAESLKIHAWIIIAAMGGYFVFAAWCIESLAKDELIEITKILAAVATGYIGYLAGRRA